jgi:hypothetical protein
MSEPRFIWIYGNGPSGEDMPFELREIDNTFAMDVSERVAWVDTYYSDGRLIIIDSRKVHSLAEACFDLKKQRDDLYAALENLLNRLMSLAYTGGVDLPGNIIDEGVDALAKARGESQ